MIKKLLTLILCLIIINCGGATYVAGLKFKKGVDAESDHGNPNSTTDVVKLSNGKFINFPRPIGECGAGITFFGILLPVVPVWFTLNSCEEEFVINSTSEKILDIKLKYNEKVYNHIAIEKWEKKQGDQVYMEGKKFKFKIDNFWKFRMADDKAIIVSGKTKDGKDFTEELPVKWGVMTYNNWVVP
ncbi:MAG: hypothetical protein KGQ36_00145 [Rickettsiales bacterium]|nr:hypothetical protein [Rickettsiales bacterium]